VAVIKTPVLLVSAAAAVCSPALVFPSYYVPVPALKINVSCAKKNQELLETCAVGTKRDTESSVWRHS